MQYEDFPLHGSFSVTAINFANDTFTYSRLLDHYQFRVIKRTIVNSTIAWLEDPLFIGPFIDRRKYKIWMCTGLH